MARKSGNYLEFEWDGGNRTKNWVKHKVKIRETEETFLDSKALISEDPNHSKVEFRWLLLGKTARVRKLAVVFTRRTNKIRVVSARPMNKKERRLYERQKNVKDS